MERDQQSDDPETRMTTILRILKDRFTGDATGVLIYLGYDRDTGRMYEKAAPPKPEGKGKGSGRGTTSFQDESEVEADALTF